jgi:hypothetical protein
MYRMFSSLFLGTALMASPAADAVSAYSNFPITAKFGVTGAGLPDGRLLIYNGDEVFLQSAPGADSFDSIAEGYEGDPAFIAIAPSGSETLMGAGGFGDPYTGFLYRFDVAASPDFTAPALTRNHYSGTYLTESLVLIDAGVFPNSELAIVDLDAKSAAPLVVVAKPTAKTLVVDPKPGYSAKVAYHAGSDTVYAMDSNTRELRSFSGAALISAFNTTTPLDWTSDGTQIGAPGDYYSGGVAGFTSEGYLIIDGSEGFGLPGGVQLVNPANGTVIATTDPAGDEGFASAIVNLAGDEVVVQQSGQVFTLSLDELAPTPPGPAPGLPLGGGAVVITTLALGVLMARKR